MSTLVIVESPTKARTLSKFLGKEYQIEASMGHIRDLPKADIGVDLENNFEPRYIIPKDKQKRVGELKKLADKADMIYLASDPDREGEAIAWHLKELITDKKTSKSTIPQEIRRVEFHEITEEAIKEAFQHPREINYQLVDAQQARRVLDRLVGYKLSPLLWKKVKSGLSAGRVQTVALRLVVEREREIEKFVPVEYWSLEAILGKKPNGEKFTSNLIDWNGKKLEVWSPDVAEKENVFFIKTEEDANQHLQSLEAALYQVKKVTQKQAKRFAPAPFTTSTLQQASGTKLGFTAKKTMMLAQNLYERGLITYMRTDSVNLSTQAIGQSRDYIQKTYGNDYLPASPKTYKAKSKNAQEAHEAIRPTDSAKLADEIGAQADMTKDHARLYELIWKRTVASQMNDAIFDQTVIDISATTGAENNYMFRANGSVLKFDGWLKLYGVKQAVAKEAENDSEEDENDPKNQLLPSVNEGEDLNLVNLKPDQHFTQPPPRFTEASLIKKLEELGIGRPSTYAPTLATIQDRFYVEKEEKKFKPTNLGTTVTEFLVKYFPDLFDYTFTAKMEDELDDVANGEREWKGLLKEFYAPMEEKIASTQELAEKVALEVETLDRNCPNCGKQLIVRTGRFGKFIACPGYPDCKYTERIEQVIEGKCPKDGGDIVFRKTKKGRPFYGCKNYPNCDYASWTKPGEEKKDEEKSDSE